MNGESNEKRTEDQAGIARFSPIQLAIAGLATAVALVILLLVVAIL
ncbi:MAG TPA: hypothetical protein VGP97_18330 [Burkholderiales bacterium]|jgi:hypothetical protein|nr:hypothetical protein [Burkholderiales bacterium]